LADVRTEFWACLETSSNAQKNAKL